MARPVGALDKNKKFLLAKLKDMYGDQFDPVMRAAELVDKMHKELDNNPELIPIVIDKWLKVAEFTNGKVSAITLSQDPENPIFDVHKIDAKMSHVEATQTYKDTLKAKPH
jgi:hypothetical protein